MKKIVFIVSVILLAIGCVGEQSDETAQMVIKSNEELIALAKAQTSGSYSAIEKAAAVSPVYKKMINHTLLVKKNTNEVCEELGSIRLAIASRNSTITPEEIKGLNKKIGAFKCLLIRMMDNDGIPDNDYLVDKLNSFFGGSKCYEGEVDKGKDLFDGVPSKSVSDQIIFLSNLEYRVCKFESIQANMMADLLDGRGVVFDQLKSMVKLDKETISVGDTLSGFVGIRAFNSKTILRVYLGNYDKTHFRYGRSVIHFPAGAKSFLPFKGEFQKLSEAEGKGIFKILAREKGRQKLQGIIEVQSSNGTYLIPFEEEYTVTR